MSRRNSDLDAVRPPLPALRQQHISRLVRYLTRGTAYIAVTARDTERASRAVDLAAERLGNYEVVRVSLSQRLNHVRPPVLSKDSGDEDIRRADPLGALAGLLSSIRAATKPVMVVIEDADLASVENLEHLRIALEAERVYGRPPRLVLCGTSVLGQILGNHNARGLASRVGHRLDLDQ